MFRTDSDSDYKKLVRWQKNVQSSQLKMIQNFEHWEMKNWEMWSTNEMIRHFDKDGKQW